MGVYIPNETLLLQRSAVVFTKFIQEFAEILQVTAEPTLQKENFVVCFVCSVVLQSAVRVVGILVWRYSCGTGNFSHHWVVPIL